MFKYAHEWENRRHAHGLLYPLLFLFFEIIFYVISVFFISQFNIFAFTLIAGLVAIYFFITSSLSRFRSVCDRQKFQNEDHTLMAH